MTTLHSLFRLGILAASCLHLLVAVSIGSNAAVLLRATSPRRLDLNPVERRALRMDIPAIGRVVIAEALIATVYSLGFAIFEGHRFLVEMVVVAVVGVELLLGASRRSYRHASAQVTTSRALIAELVRLRVTVPAEIAATLLTIAAEPSQPSWPNRGAR